MNVSLSYREAAVRGASPIGQVILLYEQAIADLQRAVDAFRAGDIESRTREINHALLVVGCLQSSLDSDRGGLVARNLGLFYNQIRTGLIRAQFEQSPALIEQQISHLALVRDAWCDVERSRAGVAAAQSTPADDERIPASSSEWKA